MALTRMLGRAATDVPLPVGDNVIHFIASEQAPIVGNFQLFQSNLEDSDNYVVIINGERTEKSYKRFSCNPNDDVIIARKRTDYLYPLFAPNNYPEVIKKLVDPLPDMYGGSAGNNTTINKDFNSQFSNCAYLEEVPNRLYANVQRGNCDVLGMFNDCTALKVAPSEFLHVFPEVTDISNLFAGCSSLTTPPQKFFCPTNKVTTALYLFQSAGITTIPSGFFDGASLLENVTGAFHSCTSLTLVDDQLFINHPYLTTVRRLFASCSNLQQVPYYLLHGATALTDASAIFEDCDIREITDRFFAFDHNLTTVAYAFTYNKNLSLSGSTESFFDYLPKVENIERLFFMCDNIKTFTFNVVSPNITNANLFVSTVSSSVSASSRKVYVPCTDGTSTTKTTFDGISESLRLSVACNDPFYIPNTPQIRPDRETTCI